MGDRRRFDLFAGFIVDAFPEAHCIADVAGGKGYLNLRLRELGVPRVITYDRRWDSLRVRNIDYRMGLFAGVEPEPFDLLVGLHPDEATDLVIVEAARRSIPFAIIPCCVKPYAATYWGQHSFKEWLAHLEGLAVRCGNRVITARLRMTGRNVVLAGRPGIVFARAGEG